MKQSLALACFLAGAFAATANTVTTTTVETSAEAKATVSTTTTTRTPLSKGSVAVGQKTAAAKSHSAQQIKVKSSSTDTEEVVAQGYGKDHAAAMANACTQAVSQVCGAAVVKQVHSLMDVSVESGGTMYDGILLSYRVLEDVKKSDGTYAVKIKAVVKPPAADMFAKRIALVLPPIQDLQATCASGNLKSATAGKLAETLSTVLETTITEDSRFVLLDRSSSLAQAERRFATSAQTSRRENQKFGNMKVADFVIDVAMKKGDESMTTREFKVAKRTKYNYGLDVQLELRLVDTVTGGIVAREVVPVSCSDTAWQEESCVQKVMASFEEVSRSSIQNGLDSLFSKISQ